MPSASDLPPELKAVANLNGLPLSDLRFDEDIGRLINALEKWIVRLRKPDPWARRPSHSHLQATEVRPAGSLGQLLPGKWQAQVVHPKVGTMEQVVSLMSIEAGRQGFHTVQYGWSHAKNTPPQWKGPRILERMAYCAPFGAA
jgi:hypothetical protein